MGLFDIFKKKNHEEDTVIDYNERSNRNDNFGTESTNSIETPSTNDTDNFRFVVEDVFSITGRGTVVTGTILSGSVSVGENVKMRQHSTGEERIIKIVGIEKFRELLDFAVAGDDVGILLKDVMRKEVERGDELYK